MMMKKVDTPLWGVQGGINGFWGYVDVQVTFLPASTH